MSDTASVLLVTGDLPPTRVQQLTTRHWFVRDWLVDACVGAGNTSTGDTLTTELPQEPTWFQRWGWYFTMVAQSIMCTTTLRRKTGEVYVGKIKLDACPISLLTMTAAKVTAAGVLTRTN
jgi:hypothetical protein